MQPVSDLALNAAIEVLSDTLPTHIVNHILDTYLLSYAQFAANIVRQFNFVPIKLHYQQHVSSAVCVHPFYIPHQRHIGLQAPLRLSPNGLPFMEAPIDTIAAHDLNLIFGGSQAFLNTTGWSQHHIDALSNGLQHHVWDTDLPLVLQRYFDNDPNLFCIGILAAALGHQYHSIFQDAAVFETSLIPDDIVLVYNDITIRQRHISGRHHNHYREAILTTMHGFDDLQPAIDSHKYPFIPLCIIGLFINDHIPDDSVSFTTVSNHDVMSVVWQTLLILKHEKPHLIERFANFIDFGLTSHKLERTDLTDAIIDRRPFVPIHVDSVMVTPTASNSRMVPPNIKRPVVRDKPPNLLFGSATKRTRLQYFHRRFDF